MDWYPNTSIFTCGVNGINTSSQRQRLSNWIFEKLFCLKEMKFKDTQKIESMGERYSINTNQKKVGVLILISDKRDFKPGSITRIEEQNS